MEERPFSDKRAEPTQEELKQALRDSFVYYNRLMEITLPLSRDWNFSKSSGWMLKVHHKHKALFYLIPLQDGFKINMAIRENEKKSLLDDNELKSIHNQIKSAKKYREGSALRFNVKNKEDFNIQKLFINKIIAFRI